MTFQPQNQQMFNFAEFIGKLSTLRDATFELRGTPEPEDAIEMRDRHRQILQIVGEYFEKDLHALVRYSGADVSPHAAPGVLADAFADFLRPEFNAIHDHILASGEFDKPPRQRSPFHEHALSARQLGVGR